jgi:hypothetical protein
MEGYAIINEYGCPLSGKLKWILTISIKKVHVFSSEERDMALAKAKEEKWSAMPEFVIPVKMTDDGVVATDKRVSAYPDNPKENE